MDILSVIVTDNSLKMQVQCRTDQYKTSPKFQIQFIECQLKCIPVSDYSLWYLLINLKKCVDDDILYISKVNCKELNITKTFTIDGDDLHVLGFYPKKEPQRFNIANKFNIEIIIDIKAFSDLRLFSEDISTTDFEIKGTDGSIRVHKVVLAATSEVFRNMITNNFKEKKEAQVELPYPKCVLQDLKDYLYLKTLNDDNLGSLFLLADYYMMCELKQKCKMMLWSNPMTEKLESGSESEEK